jgi:predicted alpha/beta hydrolase
MLCMLQGGWENLVRATLTWDFAVHRYSPIKYVPKVTAPILFIAATNDTLCAFDSVEKATQIAPNARLMARNCTHFELYKNHFEGVIHDQVSFFRQHLGMRPLPAAATPVEEDIEAAHS